MNSDEIQKDHIVKDFLEDTRFWNFVLKHENGCWLWKGALSSDGSGRIRFGTKVYSTHRIVFCNMKHKVSHRIFIRHTCENKNCCNPNHLVTFKEKVLFHCDECKRIKKMQIDHFQASHLKM